MSSSTVPALFRFQISNDNDTSSSEPTYIEYTHPVPTFLTQPSTSQQGSKEFASAFVDVISLITHQHHEECMHAITTPCPNCNKPATDALKSPMSYLHLAEPMVVIHITPVCGDKNCERITRTKWTQVQKQVMETKQKEVWSKDNWGQKSCDVCGQKDAKRCAGCGHVAYCGKDCQKEGWKTHRRKCERKKIGKDVEEEGSKATVGMI